MLDHGRIFLCVFLCCGSVLVVRAAKTDYLKTTIQNHFSQSRHHIANPDYKLAARDFIKAEFARFGLQVIAQNFKGAGHKDLTWKTFTNVIGILKGSRFGQPNDAITVIGAHYDTVRKTSGVDDNGSGVAAMLETARRMTSEYSNIKKTVIFVAFDIEEYLLFADKIGSQRFVTVWVPDWLQQNYGISALNLTINGVIVLDTVMNYNNSANSQLIPSDKYTFPSNFPRAYKDLSSDGFQGDFLALIYRSLSDEASLATSLQKSWRNDSRPWFKIESFGLINVNMNLHDSDYPTFLRSDHYHFWSNHLPAIFLTDLGNLRGQMKQCYHSPCDNCDVMLTDTNVAFLGKISDVTTDIVGKLSGAIHGTSAAPSLRYSASLLVLFVLANLV